MACGALRHLSCISQEQPLQRTVLDSLRLHGLRQIHPLQEFHFVCGVSL